jgi:hypothetical protein
MPCNVTFRRELLGGVTDFCSEVALPIATPENIVELIVLLSNYQEEGVYLKPKVYLFEDIGSIIKMLPDGEKIKIGDNNTTLEGFKRVLKKCAPLSKDGWAVYISDHGATFEFGVFSGASNPLSLNMDGVIIDGDENTKVVKISQIVSACVELKSNSSDLINVFLNHRKETSDPPLKYFDSLVGKITEGVPAGYLDTTKNLLSKIVYEALEESHGCIVAVSSKSTPPRFLEEDGTTFEEPINFLSLIKQLKNEEIKEEFVKNKSTLLKGMFNSDGIILFDNKGQLLGYNYFVNLPAEKGLVGGARKRAFSSLKSKLGRGLLAVFMQSQDGWTDFEGKDNE